jgi:hypothetical protein
VLQRGGAVKRAERERDEPLEEIRRHHLGEHGRQEVVAHEGTHARGRESAGETPGRAGAREAMRRLGACDAGTASGPASGQVAHHRGEHSGSQATSGDAGDGEHVTSEGAVPVLELGQSHGGPVGGPQAAAGCRDQEDRNGVGSLAGTSGQPSLEALAELATGPQGVGCRSGGNGTDLVTIVPAAEDQRQGEQDRHEGKPEPAPEEREHASEEDGIGHRQRENDQWSQRPPHGHRREGERHQERPAHDNHGQGDAQSRPRNGTDRVPDGQLALQREPRSLIPLTSTDGQEIPAMIDEQIECPGRGHSEPSGKAKRVPLGGVRLVAPDERTNAAGPHDQAPQRHGQERPTPQ